jgi:hypothetical protein
VLAGTVKSGASACYSDLVIESPEADEDILRIIRLAKQGCFAENMVQTAVPLTSSITVNGRDVELPSVEGREASVPGRAE